MNNVRIREAVSGDAELLATLMQEFYAEADYPLDAKRARRAFEALDREPALGRAFIVMVGADVAGYLVLTLTFSMEYGGRAAFLDDLYIRMAYRGRGVATEALGRLVDHAVHIGVRAIHLEVGRDNAPAQALYRRTGFADNDRQLLTLQLAPASHESEGTVLPSGESLRP